MVYIFKYDGWVLIGAWAAIRTNMVHSPPKIRKKLAIMDPICKIPPSSDNYQDGERL